MAPDYITNVRLRYQPSFLSGFTSMLEVQSNTEKLQERIVNKIPGEPDGYSDFSRELNFDHLFRYYFDSNKGYLDGMTI
jgi:hypothetical protein